MVKVLALTNMYPPHHLGGYELECRDILRRFRARGHECTLLTSTVRVPGVDDPPNEWDSGVRRQLELYWKDHELLSPSLKERVRMERANQQHLKQALADVDPDVVSIWHMGAMSLGLLTTLAASGIPLVYVICDSWLTYAGRHDAWMRLWRRVPTSVCRFAGRRLGVPCEVPSLGATGTFCFVSEATRKGSERGDRSRYPNATVVYSGIDTTDFPVGARPRPTWRWRLLSVGRVDPTKGLDTAIRALALVPGEATLDIVGRGDDAYIASLRRLATEVGVAERVRFAVVPRDQLAEVYRTADAFLFPVTWDEPFGLVPIEAMASGTPVIGTGTGGSREFLIPDWNALLVPRQDPGALASAVTRLAEDRELRDRLVQGGVATAAELTIDRLADVLEAWHIAAAERFVGGRPPDRAPITALLGS